MITLIRKTFTNHSTTGILLVDDTFICYTLEDVARPVGVKIPGDTAIPAGDYTIAITESTRFKRPLPLICNREDFSVSDGIKKWTGIRIHPGNDRDDTEGCILPGLKVLPDWVSGSVDAMEKLFPILEAKIKSKDTKFQIINQQQ